MFAAIGTDKVTKKQQVAAAVSFYEAMFQKGLIARGQLRLTIYIVAPPPHHGVKTPQPRNATICQ